VFDYPTSVIRELTDLRRHLVESQLAELRRLDHARDIELLFADGYCRPDWSLADCLGEDVRSIVLEIFKASIEVKHGEAELELRVRPN
jgi:hypothetical protein